MKEPFAKALPLPALSASVDRMDQYKFIPVPSESIPMWWGKLEALYKSTPETWADYEKLESIYEQHLSGRRILYICIVETELVFAISGTVQSYPMGKVVHLDWCAGRNVRDYIGLALSSLETLAWQVNAFEVQFSGREGWKKLLAPFGYHPTHVTYSKRLVGLVRSS